MTEEPVTPQSIPEHCTQIGHAILQAERRVGAGLEFVSLHMGELSTLLHEQAARLDRFRTDARTSVTEVHCEHERIQEVAAKIPSQAIENLVRMQAICRELKELNAATIDLTKEAADA